MSRVWSGSCVCRLAHTPPLSAGAGPGNQPALLWHMARFLSFLGRVWGSSCVFCPAYTPPDQCRAVVWVIGPQIVAQDSRFFVILSSSCCRSPPLGAGGRSGYFGYSDCGTNCVTSYLIFFDGVISPRPLRMWRYFGFCFPVGTFSPRPPPVQVIWRWFSLTFILSLTGSPLFFPCFLVVPCRLRGLAVQRCGSGF